MTPANWQSFQKADSSGCHSLAVQEGPNSSRGKWKVLFTSTGHAAKGLANSKTKKMFLRGWDSPQLWTLAPSSAHSLVQCPTSFPGKTGAPRRRSIKSGEKQQQKSSFYLEENRGTLAFSKCLVRLAPSCSLNPQKQTTEEGHFRNGGR